MLPAISNNQTIQAISQHTQENVNHEFKAHVNKVNYFLRFLDSKHKTMIGMISYDEIIKGLRKEEAYFESRTIAIAFEMKELLSNFLDQFEAFLQFEKAKSEGFISAEELENGFTQMALFMMPFLFENTKTLTFLQATLLTALVDGELPLDDFLFVKEKLNNVVNYFSTFSRALINLEQYQQANLINEENLEEFFIDLFFIINDMEDMTRPLEILAKQPCSSPALFREDFMTFCTSISSFKISLNKMFDEKVQNEKVSPTTLQEVMNAYKNFFNAIRAPRELTS